MMKILRKKLRIIRANKVKRFLMNLLPYVKKERDMLYWKNSSNCATEDETNRWKDLERYYDTISSLIFELDHIIEISKMEEK